MVAHEAVGVIAAVSATSVAFVIVPNTHAVEGVDELTDDKGQVRVIGGKLLPYELNHSPTDACQSLQLPH